MKITHLRRVAVTAPDPDALASFYEDVWGLAPVDKAGGDVVHLRGTSDEHHLVSIHPGASSALFRFTLGLLTAADVDTAAEQLEAVDGVRVVRPPGTLDEPGGGYGMTIADPDGREIELAADVKPAGPSGHAPPIAPHKLSHVVLNSPDVDAYQRFLVDILGFRLADEAAHMVFLKCNRDHHTVALTRAPHASLNHVAFEVPDVDDVRNGVDHLRARGYETIWGPGRHGPGRNVFGYFVAPNGHVIEYTADIEQIDDADVAPHFWVPEEYQLYDDWADPSTLRPTPEARELMLGEPERLPHEPAAR